MQVTVYTAGPACQGCRLTKMHLKGAGIPYDEHPLNDDVAAAARKQLPHQPSAPIVIADTPEGLQLWDQYRPDKLDALKAFR